MKKSLFLPASLSEEHQIQQGFTLIEVLVAALILAVAVAGMMRLHTQNLRNTASHDELQRAYWIVSNAQQRWMFNGGLTDTDLTGLKNQANSAGLESAKVIHTNSEVGLQWIASDSNTTVQRNCQVVETGRSCIALTVKRAQ